MPVNALCLLVIVTSVLITSISFATEDNQFSSVPIIPASHPNDTLRQSEQKALAHLVSSQNADGSFGHANNRIMETSLALIALTRTPQLGTSHKKSIASAADWIRRCPPESDAEKLAVIMALSGLYTRDSRKADEDDSMKNADFSNIDTLLIEVDGNNNGVWRDALAMTKLPDGVAKPDWIVNDNATHDKYRRSVTLNAVGIRESVPCRGPLPSVVLRRTNRGRGTAWNKESVAGKAST